MIRRSLVYVAAALLAAAVLAQPAREVAPLPPELPWEGQSLELALSGDHEWATPFERSGLERTPRYAETVDWLRRLVAASPRLQMVSLGRSAERRDIWMIVASSNGAGDPAALQQNNRPTLLVHAGIHSGEIDGKDAGMMLLRDMTVRDTPRRQLLERVNLLFIPILSVDAHERFSRFGRINQRGPVEMGWRTNGRNLNLNRDYAKLETEELQALVQAIGRWRPDLYVDIHVTDGADYQYDVTYGYNGAHAWSPNIAAWLDGVLTPVVDKTLARMGHTPGRLTFAVNRLDMQDGTVDWTAGPRFSNGWGDARHLPTVLVENHSLKPFHQRVLGTYVLLESVMTVLGQDFGALRRARARDLTAASPQVVLGWSVGNPAPERRRKFLGVRSERYESSVSGATAVRWTGEPVVEEIPVRSVDRPVATVRRPAFYYIPAAWYPIADKLRLQGIEVEILERATTVEVEQYRLPDARLDTASSPFEGRARYTPGEPVVERRTLTLPAGSTRVSARQPLGTLAVLLLEPGSPDSLFQWGYLAELLQRTEYVEDYVMEPMARAMLAQDPALQREFEHKLRDDADFAADADARLRWFYERTPYHDAEYLMYPIMRSVD